ncbi:MAG: acetylxylan esterase [Kiritimatiellae bacterium]|jgi:cephalosporin-C deacetylase|nr:acetylxylan esterase [Kiritimatiellia bacterium]
MLKNIIVVVCFVLSTSVFAQNMYLWGNNDKETPIYKPGEKMVFTIKLLNEEDRPVAGKKLTWTRTGDDGIKESGEGVSSTNGYEIITSTDAPGFVRIYVNALDNGSKILSAKDRPIFFDGGACVEPEKLKGFPEPTDFDEFWTKQKAILAETPLKILEMKEVEGTGQVKVFDVKLSCAGKMPVSGILSMPKNAEPGSLPAQVSFHGYGVRGANRNIASGRNKIVFDINAHGIENGQPAEYYSELSKGELAGYGFDKEKNLKHETVYFREMFLRALRALEFVKTLPEWNGKDLEAIGGSQGGLQSLAAAGLDNDVTYCYAWSPWCCDMVGRVEYKRLIGGWYVRPTPVMAYYDPVNFIKRANPKCKLNIIANLGDYTCPPSGVWIAYNNFPGPKTITVKQGCEHGYTMKNAPVYKELKNQ